MSEVIPRTSAAWDVPQAEFLSQVRRYAALRTDGPSEAFYGQMLAQARSTFPKLTAPEYERLTAAVRAICMRC
jgi:hypothetical protein